MLSRAAWGSPHSPSGFQSMWTNPWQSQSRSPSPLSRETGSISWDYTQHLKENIYRIYIHIPFALFSGGSPVPSLPPARTPSPPPASPVLPQCPPL